MQIFDTRLIPIQFFIILLIAACTPVGSNRVPVSGPMGNAPFKGEPGKCYAKCKLANASVATQHSLPVYTGNKKNAPLRDTTIVLQVASKKWVKKQDPKSNDKDMLIWCLEETPAEYVTMQYLADTVAFKTFEMRNFEARPDASGEYTEWQEVVCAHDINEKLINRIAQALIAKDMYNTAVIPKEINEDFKKALLNYQVAHGLPKGQLDVETMEHLGVKF